MAVAICMVSKASADGTRKGMGEAFASGVVRGVCITDQLRLAQWWLGRIVCVATERAA